MNKIKQNDTMGLVLNKSEVIQISSNHYDSYTKILKVEEFLEGLEGACRD